MINIKGDSLWYLKKLLFICWGNKWYMCNKVEFVKD